MLRFNPLRRWRPLCALFGCRGDWTPGCERCGAHWDEDRQFRGLVPWFKDMLWVTGFAMFWTIDRLLGRRCWHCKRRIAPWRSRVDEDFCSQSCAKKYVPF